MPNCQAISVTILTKNSAKYLHEVLSALQAFGEVLIYDTGSTDATLEIAQQFPNACIYRAKFEGFGPTHNLATSLAKNDWVLSLDSDEIATPQMVQTIANLQLEPACVYSFARHNFYNGKWIKGCGWYPDRQFRLYHRKKTRFTDAQVHECIITEGLRHQPLKAHLKHYSYGSASDFLAKMQSYSELFARQNTGIKTSSVAKAIGHALFAFFKSYLIKRGFLDGGEGLIISVYNANTAFYKYIKLQEYNRRFFTPE